MEGAAMREPLVFGTPEANKLASPYLKPCPFCGEGDGLIIDKKYVRGMWFFYVACPCGTEGPDSALRSRAVTNWNERRTP